MTTKANNTKMRGFASLSKEERIRVSRLGGQASHAQGKAHRWTGGKDGTAADAGRLGGSISRRRGPNKPKSEE